MSEVTPEARLFYRIIRSNPPTRDDFTSRAEQGHELPNPTPERKRLWEGISVYATLAQARRNCRRFPQLGSYIAVIDISSVRGLVYERTTHQPGHFTIWGVPESMLESVVSIEPVG